MKLYKFLDWKVYLLLFFLVLMLLAINPTPWKSGVEAKSVSGAALESGLEVGETILEINTQKMSTVSDFDRVSLEISQMNATLITLTTDNGTFSYPVYDSLGFTYDENLTLTSIKSNITGTTILSFNNVALQNQEQLDRLVEQSLQREVIRIQTPDGEVAFIYQGTLGISVREARKSNLIKGLELEGGTRVLLKPISEQPVTNQQINDLIAVLANRLNVYGLSDLKIRSADVEDEKLVVIEIAGVGKEEVVRAISMGALPPGIGIPFGIVDKVVEPRVGIDQNPISRL